MFKRIILYAIVIEITCSALPAQARAEDYDKFLDRVERQAFDYFWNETYKTSGLTLNSNEGCSPASNAASGFMLSALVIGTERGWITHDQAYSAALKTLTTFKKAKDFEGFTYHYFNIANCGRMWTSEVSCIDTGLFLAGALTAGEYFKETEVAKLADELFRATNWAHFLDGENVLQMAWKPEKGFFARIDTFSEGIICYILAMGSPTYPIPKECWDSFSRPVSEYGGYKMIYVSDGSLFQYLFPLAWLDLRDRHDKYADYWQNAIKAIKANKKYCMDNSSSFPTYKEGFWGLSASLSADGYKNFGAKPGMNKHNGTVAPYAVAGSIPFTPEFSISDYKLMYDKAPQAVGKYGLTSAFNIGRDWASPYYLAIDEGLTLLMIENYRTGLIWKYFTQNEYVKKGLNAAGFVPGRQDQPSSACSLPGNPNDIIKVGGKDGKAAEIILTSKDNKNVEITAGYVRDDADLSGKFWLSHDDKNLYVTGQIKDDEIVTRETGTNIYKDDCVEIFFDVDKNGFYFDRNPHDYQLGIAPSGPGGKPQIWAWGYLQKIPDKIKYSIELTQDGYNIETVIPFDAINGFGPGKAANIGFAISIHDRDKNGKQKKLVWSIDSASQPGKIFFGTLELVD